MIKKIYQDFGVPTNGNAIFGLKFPERGREIDVSLNNSIQISGCILINLLSFTHLVALQIQFCLFTILFCSTNMEIFCITKAFYIRRGTLNYYSKEIRFLNYKKSLQELAQAISVQWMRG
uniref:Uncharacterized protein n=1 Tax=Micrurus spixii TaxID=129469 RepID=A0A2D4MUP4_9SAUR